MQEIDTLYEKIKEFNEEELFYRDYYNVRKDPKELQKYLKSLDMNYLSAHGYWIPELKYTSANYFTEYFLEDIRKNIEISKHNRYTPLFLHKHAFFEMVYVLSGSCENTVDGCLIKMNEGDICILAPDINHTMGVFEDDSIVINIIIRRSTFKEIFEGLFNDDTVLSMFFNRILYSNTTSSHLLFPASKDKELQSILDMLILEGTKHDKYYKTAMENLLRTAFCFMLRKQEYVVVSNSMCMEHPEMMNILRYIQDRYKTVNMHELSERFKYSPDYLGKIIKRNTGTTFIKILRDIRFKKACNILLNTNINVIEVCYEVGYESVEFFNRTFKKLCGMTPTEYRRKSSEFSCVPPSQRSIALNNNN